MTSRVLVAGIGNIFLGDDAFGVEVAGRLAKLDLPDWVAVGDYGTSGLHLAYDLADGVELAILVDAVPRGGDPGTVYVIEPEQPVIPAGGVARPAAFFDGHGMQPDVVLSLLGSFGAQVGRVLIVGCEPASVEYGMGLSPPVTAAVDEAVRRVVGLIGELR
jgi:hydrogenase maturation protease